MGMTVYKGTDFGAPNLSNVAGSLIDVLDACLVDGFGNQSISITRSGSVATITCTTPHGFLLTNKYEVSGADLAEYNGIHRVNVVDSLTLTFDIVGTPTSPATGTITGRLAPAGWTKQFSGTNKAAYKQGAGSNGMVLRVDDSGSPDPTLSIWRGFESMSDIDTGLGQFPLESQLGSTDMWAVKADDAVNKEWIVFADETLFYFYSNINESSSQIYGDCAIFGDITSSSSSDMFSTIILAGWYGSVEYGKNSTGGTGKCWMPRDHLGTPGIPVRVGLSSHLCGSTLESGSLVYPNGTDNTLYLTQRDVITSGNLRGHEAFTYAFPHSRPLNHLDTFSGSQSGGFPGDDFLVLNGYNFQIAVKISD